MKQKFLTTIALAVIPLLAAAQPSSGYYTSNVLNGKKGQDLELALKGIVYPHTELGYNSLWKHYETTDPGPSDSIPATATKQDLVYDMYAWMSQFPKFYQDNDHSQTSGINREHSVPNSWWGGKSGNPVAYTDLHHLVPSDGAANNAKSNYALGEYRSGMTLVWPTETKENKYHHIYMVGDTHDHFEGVECTACASHVWQPADDSEFGGSARLFEPANEYKGDFARMYLYVVCAYEGEFKWREEYMFKSDAQRHTTIKDWARDLLLKWHHQDPVSDKERARNNAVESIQHNRNPFIDYPELVDYIWGDKNTQNFQLEKAVSAYSNEYKDGSNSAYHAKELTLEAKSGNSHYATFCSKSVTFFPKIKNGMTHPTTLRKVTSESDGRLRVDELKLETVTVKDTEIEGYFVPANTGVLIQAAFDAGNDHTKIPFYTVENKLVDAFAENLMHPASEEMTGDYKFYKLAYDDAVSRTGLGFYWGADDGAAFTIKPGTAYLRLPKDSGIRSFVLDDIVDAIRATEVGKRAGNAIYNLQGQRVKAMRKGIYIINGKKVVLK